MPIIVTRRGHLHLGHQGKRYIDGLSGLFVVNAGHGRDELAEAAAKQAQELAFFPIWSLRPPHGHRAGRPARATTRPAT